ncbi:MAG TPA: DUF1292 domain-containing protein [Clostridiales bacterium]|mgnify:CR=1 FL=1|jgi:hypothetical protein|nr:DUF1292 domain-containing protein [Clostridiales bacterium]
MDKRPDEITFITDDNKEVIFQVIEQTRLGGVDYLLVCTTDKDEALILKDVSKDTDMEAIYNIVDDDAELAIASEIFRELIEDIELY